MADLLRLDICVIGGGAGGLSVATAAAAFGVQVALVERGELGGGDLSAGCVPSKPLIASARLARNIGRAQAFGLDAAAGAIDFGRVRDHVRRVIAAIAPNNSRERFNGLGVRVVEGEARFLDSRTVAVGDDIRIMARRFVIATGSALAMPPIPGLASVPYFTTETIFDLTSCPEHLLVIGGGSLGLELAQAFRRLGAEVTVLEAGDTLPDEDPEGVQIVLDALAREGIEIRTRVSIVRVGEVSASETAQARADQVQADLPQDLLRSSEVAPSNLPETAPAHAMLQEAARPGQSGLAGACMTSAAREHGTGEVPSSSVLAVDAVAADMQSLRAPEAQTGIMSPPEAHLTGTHMASVNEAAADPETTHAAEAPIIAGQPAVSDGPSAATEATPTGTQGNVRAISNCPLNIEIAFTDVDGDQTIVASHILVATARRPNVEGIGLEAAGVKYDLHGIEVDRTLKTSNRRVYAIGDATGMVQCTHAAIYHADLVVQNALFRRRVQIDEDGIPRVTFTDPELAQAGLTEAQARHRGHSICVLRWPYSENDRAQAEHETVGHIKVVTNKKGRILGVTIVGASAGELVTTWILAMRHKLNVQSFSGMIIPLSTFGEIGRRAAITYFTQNLTRSWVRRIITGLRRFG